MARAGAAGEAGRGAWLCDGAALIGSVEATGMRALSKRSTSAKSERSVSSQKAMALPPAPARAGATDAVHVALGHVGKVVVDDVRDAVDVDAARRESVATSTRDGARAETLERALARALRLVAVNGSRARCPRGRAARRGDWRRAWCA